MNIVEEIRKFVEEECKKPSSKYGYQPYSNHFVPMVKYALELSKGLNCDVEVVQLAAWLHDIGSIVHGRESHHITGAKIAEDKLKTLGYPSQKIELIKKCVLNHRGSVKSYKSSVEEQIISEADAISNFDNIEGIFMAAFMYENLNQKEARQSAREKLKRKWEQLTLEKSKEFIKPKYEAAMLLLSEKK